MSLFRAREWWSTTCGDNEEFDQACLAVGNVDDAEDGEAKIVVGGFSGVLRAYAPKKREFEADHLILEHDLRAPVLQIAMSDFGVNDANGEARIALAVLHPRKLRVFVCEVVGEPGASFHELRLEYEHALAAPACNMTVGPFKGSVYDGICVQTLDGALEVFDRETVDFRARLPDFLVPGPLAYCPRMDAFVTVNSKFEMEKFSLKTLAATENKTDAGPEPDWRLCLGEGATQITSASGFSDAQVVASNGAPSRVDLIALGERTLFVVSESGQFLMQKRLDYAPSVMHAFRVNPASGERSPVHVFVADCTGAGMLYRGSQTLWAAKFDAAPVAMLAGARFGGADGMLVTLTEFGNLAVGYLGTAPPVDVVRGYATNKEVGFAEMERERAKLTAMINDSAGAWSGGADATSPDFEKIELSARVPAALDTAPRGVDAGDASRAFEKTLTVEVLVTFTGVGSCEDVTLTVSAPAPATCAQTTFVLPFVRGGKDTPSSVRVALRVPPGAGVPAGNAVRLVAGYRVKGTGEPRVATHEARVPLSLFAERIAPVKRAAHKVTLDTNRAPPLLASLFFDADPQDGSAPSAAAANVVSFAYGDGSDVTVIVSKNAGRYRLQSSSFGAMWLVLDELCRRLRRYYAAEEAGAGADENGAEPFAVSFAEALPLQDFFAAVDAHHAARAARNGALATLSDRARQFRAVQKRLLVRFKDKNPQSLEHLDAVLAGAYGAVTSEAAEAEAREAALRAAHGELAAATRVVQRLIALKFALSDAEVSILEAYLSADEALGGNDVPECGWEELTEAATTALLKTKLAKGGDRGAAGGGMGSVQPLAPLQDTTKLKKHIAVVCERLARGARLAG